MTWPSPLEWLGIVGTLATLTSLVLAWGARDTKKILTRMDQANRASHETSQGMLERMDRGTKEILERMDRQAEARYRDLKDRLDGEAEGQP
jgi:hypothetical protein